MTNFIQKEYPTSKNHAYRMYDNGEITLHDLKQCVIYFSTCPDQEIEITE